MKISFLDFLVLNHQVTFRAVFSSISSGDIIVKNLQALLTSPKKQWKENLSSHIPKRQLSSKLDTEELRIAAKIVSVNSAKFPKSPSQCWGCGNAVFEMENALLCSTWILPCCSPLLVKDIHWGNLCMFFVCEGTKCPLPWRQNTVLLKLKRPEVPYNAKITGSFTSTYLS